MRMFAALTEIRAEVSQVFQFTNEFRWILAGNQILFTNRNRQFSSFRVLSGTAEGLWKIIRDFSLWGCGAECWSVCCPAERRRGGGRGLERVGCTVNVRMGDWTGWDTGGWISEAIRRNEHSDIHSKQEAEAGRRNCHSAAAHLSLCVFLSRVFVTICPWRCQTFAQCQWQNVTWWNNWFKQLQHRQPIIFGPSPTLAELIGLQLTPDGTRVFSLLSFSLSQWRRKRTTSHFPDEIKII